MRACLWTVRLGFRDFLWTCGLRLGDLWTLNFTDFLWIYIGDLHGEFVDLLMDLHSRFVDLLVDLKISMNYIYRLAP